MNRASLTSRLVPLAAWPAATLLLIAAMAIIVTDGDASVRNPGDLALLVALSLASYLAGAFALPVAGVRIDIGLVLTLAGIILTGPIGGLIVMAAPELICPLAERWRVRRIATLSNLASFAWMVVAGQAVLLALGGAEGTSLGRALTYLLAAAAMVFANFIVTRGIVAGLVDRALISGWRIELHTLGSALALAPFAALTACLLPSLGVLALAAAAAAEALLGVLVRLAAWTPRADGLTVPDARSRYAAALASRMSMSRSERRVLLAAARSGTGRIALWLSPGDRDRVAKTLLLAGLWSKSDDRPDDCFSRLAPAEMGIESRVLLVAHGWAELTAMGTEHLEHRLALLTLHNNPRRYDRRIVALARELVPDSEREAERARVPHARELRRRIAQITA